MSQNVRNLSARKGLADNLFERIAEARQSDGALDRTALGQIADKFLIGKANTYGAATFYDFLDPEKAGKKAFVCNGSACLLAGTQAATRRKLEGKFSPEEIGEVYCLGRCYENGAFHCGGRNFSGAEIAGLEQIVAAEAISTPAPYRIAHLGKAILTTEKPDETDCLQILKNAFQNSPGDFLAEIQTANLRGRGGAGFPMHIKLATVKKEAADKKYIVCNADEGDPGAFSDRYVLEEKPHLLMAGMALAGFAAGADEGVVYIRAEYPEAIEICREVAARFNRFFPFEKPDGTVVNFHLHVMRAQGAYICGEETALLNSIEGLRAEVRTRPPFPAQFGLFGKPTAVNNVETLANLPFIAQNGGEMFRGTGTAKCSGTKLFSLDGHFNRPGLYEVEMGLPLAEVIEKLGGGFRTPVKALHIGGPLGGLVPTEKIGELTCDIESFAAAGFLLGHASVICIPEAFPLVEYLEHLFAFTAHESCGKCFPCRLGSVRGRELLHKARTSSFRIDPVLFDDLLETLEKGSLCGLGGGLPLPVKNAMQYFRGELGTFFKG